MELPKNALGLILVGEYAGEELQDPYPTKGGETIQNKIIVLKTGPIDFVKVEVPKEFKIEKDSKGMVALPVKTSAKTWNELSKRFSYVNVTFYVPRT